MKTHTKTLLAALVCTGMIGPASAAMIVSDDFSTLDPAWGIDVNSDGEGGDLNFSSNGTDVIVREELGAGGADNEGTMTRTFDASGFTDVTLTVDIPRLRMKAPSTSTSLLIRAAGSNRSSTSRHCSPRETAISPARPTTSPLGRSTLARQRITTATSWSS